MDFAYLFTSPQGRINRKPYWLASLLVGVIAVVLLIVLSFILPMPLATLIYMAAILYPAYMLMVKRLHDRDRPDYWAYIMLAPAVLYTITGVLGLTGRVEGGVPVATALDFLMGILLFGIGLWSFVELGCLRGTVGPNQYGPDPLQGQP